VHWRRNDSRINVVTEIVSQFQLQLNSVIEQCENDDYIYWDSCYADDTEHLVGTVFIILQNYINSSISDLFPELTKLYTKYSLDIKIFDSKTTRIELIIAIANYYKHRDLPTKLHENTSKTLDNLNIDYNEIFDTQSHEYFHKVGAGSPIFYGFSLLSEKWSFNDLISIISEWRENMWLNEEKILEK
jgi:hypothetical protein